MRNDAPVQVESLELHRDHPRDVWWAEGATYTTTLAVAQRRQRHGVVKLLGLAQDRSSEDAVTVLGAAPEPKISIQTED